MGSVVVITGASSGIGAAAVKTFLKHGHKVAMIDRNAPPTVPEGASFYQLDITDPERVGEVVDRIENELGPIDCLVNSAGIAPSGRILEEDISNWKKVMSVNALGTFYVLRKTGEKMVTRKSGTIITLNSIAGKKTYDQTSAYAASKHALGAFCEILRGEMAPHGIRCISIAPGDVETPINDSLAPEVRKFWDEWLASIAPILQPEEVAEIIYWTFVQPKHVCIREIVVCPTKMVI